jgi:hypothetical protein
LLKQGLKTRKILRNTRHPANLAIPANDRHSDLCTKFIGPSSLLYWA